MSEAEGKAKRSGVFIVLGVLNILLGIFLLGSPFMAGIITTFLLGGILLVGGIVELVHAFTANSWKAGILKFFGGVLALIVGALFLFQPLKGLEILSWVIAVFFLMDGLSRIVAAFKVKPERGWGWLLFGGIITTLLGGYILADWPLSALWVIGLLVGIRMLFTGWAMIFAGAAAKSLTPREAT